MGINLENNIASKLLEEYKNGTMLKMFHSYYFGCSVSITELTEDDIKQNLIYYMGKQGTSDIFNAYVFILSDLLLQYRRYKIIKIKDRICLDKMK